MASNTKRISTRAIFRLRTLSIGATGLALAALAALPLLWRALMRMVQLLAYPFPHDGLEGTLLHEARLLWAGQPLYQPLELLRFVSAPYPPLHALALGLADQIAGPHVFWGGRILSLAAALGIALLVIAMIRCVVGGWLGGLIGAALFLSAPPVILWATRIKPDLFALFWTMLGLFVATRALAYAEQPALGSAAQAGMRSPWGVWRRFAIWPAAAICFVLAAFTKQTAVAAPLGVGLALVFADAHAWWRGERASLLGRVPLSRRTLLFGLTYAALVLGVWVLLDLVTRGQYSAHVWGLHRSEWWSPYLLRKFVELLARWVPAALLGLLLLPRAVAGQRWLPLLGYLLVVPISLLGAGETGANHNHLLESHLALALAAGCAAGWAATLPLRRWPAFGLVFILLGVQIALASTPPRWYRGELAPRGTPARYLDFIRSQPGEVLADDVALLLQAGRQLRYDDPSTMGPAAQSGVWDQSGLVREIAERRFSAILIPADAERKTTDATGRWTPQMLAAIRQHYRVLYRDTIMVYVPK